MINNLNNTKWNGEVENINENDFLFFTRDNTQEKLQELQRKQNQENQEINYNEFGKFYFDKMFA